MSSDDEEYLVSQKDSILQFLLSITLVPLEVTVDTGETHSRAVLLLILNWFSPLPFSCD